MRDQPLCWLRLIVKWHGGLVRVRRQRRGAPAGKRESSGAPKAGCRDAGCRGPRGDRQQASAGARASPRWSGGRRRPTRWYYAPAADEYGGMGGRWPVIAEALGLDQCSQQVKERRKPAAMASSSEQNHRSGFLGALVAAATGEVIDAAVACEPCAYRVLAFDFASLRHEREIGKELAASVGREGRSTLHRCAYRAAKIPWPFVRLATRA
jgi:hypothetical protein